uniref:LigA n=1 Tax=Parastrongyloides trichosuri TaxID=131310 RepID=A0A0N5A603_PARTI
MHRAERRVARSGRILDRHATRRNPGLGEGDDRLGTAGEEADGAAVGVARRLAVARLDHAQHPARGHVPDSRHGRVAGLGPRALAGVGAHQLGVVLGRRELRIADLGSRLRAGQTLRRPGVGIGNEPRPVVQQAGPQVDELPPGDAAREQPGLARRTEVMLRHGIVQAADLRLALDRQPFAGQHQAQRIGAARQLLTGAAVTGRREDRGLGDLNSHPPAEAGPQDDDRTNALAFMHQIEGRVDLIKRHGVGDQLIDIDLAIHVPVNDFRHIGAAARTAECCAFPDTAGDQLERTGGDFLASFGHADDDALAPAAVTGFQRLTHDHGVAGAVEGVVGAAVGKLDQMGHHVRHVLRIDEVGHAEATAPLFLVAVDVDADDHVGPDHLQPLNDVQADAAQAEDHGVGARLDLGGIDHSADAGGNAAADVADLVERRVFTHFGQRDFRQHGEVREGRAAHIMEKRLALVGKARGAVGHQALALRGPDRGAQVGLAALAELALAAFRRVQRDDVVADGQRGHARPHLDHHARALMAQDRGEETLAVQPVQRIGVGVADPRRLDLDQHLARARTLQIDLDDLKRTFGFERDGGAGFHDAGPSDVPIARDAVARCFRD